MSVDRARGQSCRRGGRACVGPVIILNRSGKCRPQGSTSQRRLRESNPAPRGGSPLLEIANVRASGRHSRAADSRDVSTPGSRRLLRGSSEHLPPLYNTASSTGVGLMCPVRAPRS
jgi:hypothetical protein